jgi:CxxC motif-containing protein (DUF1111 family)
MKAKWGVISILLSCGIVVFFSCLHKPPTPPQIGEPLADLTQAQLAQLEQGKKVFQRVFTPQDGLGPLFNGNSCAECHEAPVVGGAGDEVEVHATRFIAPQTCDPLFQEGGPVIQQEATPLLQAHGIQKEAIPPSATGPARRSSPPVFGFGLIDAIPEQTILAYEDPNDADHDGIAGRANRTIDGRVGRFGRKAAVASLFDFNAGAFPQEMGITTPLSPVEETINGQPVPPDTDPTPDPEISLADIQHVTTFVRFLSPPPRKLPKDHEEAAQVERGEKLFAELRCARCHVPEMRTGPSTIAALDRKTVALYSDLLLHDMGPSLADICLGQAKPSEFRTELLMGLRFREKFLHDGSATTVRQAIERHDGEAKQAREAFHALSEKEKAVLLLFLGTL